MDATTVLADAFGRIRDHTAGVARALDEAALTWRPDAQANPIGWLLWHLTRVEDDHLAEIAGREQVWREGAWHARFGLAQDRGDTGYGHTPEQVDEVRPDSVSACLDYQESVADRVLEIVGGLDGAELERVIDASYNPPVTVAVRLVSVVEDAMAHLGQAGYVRGLYERRR